MRIAVPKESKSGEARVALAPAACRELTALGHVVTVQMGAGVESGYDDDAYRAAGAEIIEQPEELWRQADLVVKVKEPSAREAGWMRSDQILFCYLHLAALPELAEDLRRSGVTAIGFETVTDDAGGLPLLAPMSTIAGRLAAHLGTQMLWRHRGGKGLLLGGIAGAPRGRAVVVGVGNAGLECVRSLAAQGAEVLAFDLDPRRLELAHALGPNVTARYAEAGVIEEALVAADLLVGAVLVPGAAAPKVVSRQAVARMAPGSVVVDIAVDQGGCIETTRPTDYSAPTYVEAGVVHFAVTNMPGAVPRTASEALSGRLLPYLRRLAAGDWSDPGLLNGVNLRGGEIVHPAVAAALGRPRR